MTLDREPRYELPFLPKPAGFAVETVHVPRQFIGECSALAMLAANAVTGEGASTALLAALQRHIPFP